MGSSKATHELWKEEVSRHIRTLDSNARWRLQPQFEFQFDTKYTGDLDWYKVTSCLFGYENLTDTFFAGCELMNKHYQQLDESQLTAPAIPIRLVFSSIRRSDDVNEIPPNLLPSHTTRRKISSQIKFIQGIVELIQQIQREATRMQRLYPARPRFSLHSIELHLGDYSFSPALVRELERLLALDVEISKFKVPTVMTRTLLEQPQLWRHVWGSLLLTVTVHVNTKTHLHHTIDELVISLCDNAPEEMYQAIASVMVNTQKVKSSLPTK